MNRPTTSPCYEIRVRGHLSPTLLGAFPGLHAETEGSATVLTGTLPDQSALHGVLAQIESLGLELTGLRRRGDPPANGRGRGEGRA
ncbi:hypothetical protein [Streptomyces sp. NPDC048385]|uniref:BON domain-containing protein n=1 Tax=Streptomyces sp. R39 TaxID=3238631 RepID=A0AB39QZ52_9ACTN